MKPRLRLYPKFVLVLVAVVSSALCASGALQAWYSYTEQVSAAHRILQIQAEAVGEQVQQFVKELERQVGWTTHFSWPDTPLDQRKLDAARLLRQAPAITEFAHLDPDGREQIRFSRLTSTVVGSGADFSSAPAFTEAAQGRPYYGSVEFLRGSEPHMAISVAGTRRATGVSVAQINLRFIWDLVREVRIGAGGGALVVDAAGRLIAHRDILLVLQNNDLSKSEQYQVAVRRVGESAGAHKNFLQNAVFSGVSRIDSLGWTVIVELPQAEVLEPIHRSMWRTGYLLLVGLGVAFASGMFLTQQVLKPVRALQEGTSRIAEGDFSKPLNVKSGDELQALAERFNDMAREIFAQRGALEQTVAARTNELAKAIQELKELGNLSRQINSTLVFHAVLGAILKGAIHLSHASGAAIYMAEPGSTEMELAGAEGGADFPPTLSVTAAGKASSGGELVTQVSSARDMGGRGAKLILPFTHQQETMGALVLRSQQPFQSQLVDLLTTFASQSALAILNAKLYKELEHRSRELETASEYKTRFLANMSHELRTPLNAIIGFSELLMEGAYGMLPLRAQNSLERILYNGRHLLGLINEVLDLSRIEAGQYELVVSQFSPDAAVAHVIETMTPLAQAKGLALLAPSHPRLPLIPGDERRIIQVLLNLVGNAIKYTQVGSVSVQGAFDDNMIEFIVTDTGMGIAAADQEHIFKEFHQLGPLSTRREGGSGLGLAISKRIAEMHGGTLTVDSAPGRGATFRVRLPIQPITRSSLG